MSKAFLLLDLHRVQGKLSEHEPYERPSCGEIHTAFHKHFLLPWTGYALLLT